MLFQLQEAKQQLQSLGKDVRTTRIRVIHPTEKKPRIFDFDETKIEAYISQGFNIYFSVNDGGDKKADITDCRALFVEWDDKPIEWQINAWKELGLPEPSMQVLTGNKSVHTYWILTEPVGAQIWESITARLIKHCDSDPAIKDASRVMRLVGAAHAKTGQNAQIIHQSDVTYSLSVFDELLPPIEQELPVAPKAQGKFKPSTLTDIQEAFNFIPARPGTDSGTYPIYRNITWGLIKACEEAGGGKDDAVQMIKSAGWKDFDVEQVAGYDATLVHAATFWHHARVNGYKTRPDLAEIAQQGVTEMRTGHWWRRLPDMHSEKRELVKLNPLELSVVLGKSLTNALKFNALTYRAEIDGEEMSDDNMSLAYIDLMRCGINSSDKKACDAFLHACRVNTYHPIQDFLDSVDDPLPDSDWQYIADRIFGGTYSEAHNSACRKWFRGGCKCIYEPGKTPHHSMVAVGPQGCGKTEAGKKLLPESLQQYFCDSFIYSPGDRDRIIEMHENFIIEFGEMESSFTGKTMASFKGFLTKRLDNVRKPYGRFGNKWKREQLFWGTSNCSDGLLVDDTGNRRFVVFETERTNLQWIETNRDRIWASAKRDYKQGLPIQLDKQETADIDGINNQYLVSDAWGDKLASWLVNNDVTDATAGHTTITLLTDVLGVKTQFIEPSHQQRLSVQMKKLGWANRRVMKNRVREVRYYRVK